MVKRVSLLKMDDRLVLHDTELTDAVIDVNLGVTHGENRHVPLVIVAAVGFVDDTHVIGLDDAKILECGTSGHHMGLITRRKLHGDA